MKKWILAIVLCLTMFCSVACENTLTEQFGQMFGTSQEQGGNFCFFCYTGSCV